MGAEFFLEPSTLCLVLCSLATILLGCYMSTNSAIIIDTEKAGELKPVTLGLAIALPILGSVMLILLFYFMNILQYLLYIVIGFAAFSSLSLLLQPISERLVDLILVVHSVPLTSPLRRHKGYLSAAFYMGIALCATVAWGVTLAWPLSNLIAVTIGIVCISGTRLPSMKVCAVLLGLFFVYDIFWVFLSGNLFGSSVMVSVAQGLVPEDGKSIPVLLTFRTFIANGGSNLLGMGDVLIPGLFLCYLYRVDQVKLRTGIAAQQDWGYFLPALAMYYVGLLITFLVLLCTGSGQPALLYLVPCIFAAPCVQGFFFTHELEALWKGSFFVPNETLTQNNNNDSSNDGENNETSTLDENEETIEFGSN